MKAGLTLRTKDFGFFQQHVEKIFLGVGVLVLLGVAATQFLMGQPNAVELEGKAVPPGEIKDTVVKKSEVLKRNLAMDSPIERIDVPQYTDSFNRLFGLPVATDQGLASIDAPGIASDLHSVVSPDYPNKVLPTPPMSEEVLATTGHAVLADDTDRAFAIREIVGDAQPGDFPYVSVSMEFSFDELKKRYTDPSIPAEQRIDEGLWRERLAITSVRLLREERDPLTGEWGNRTVVKPLPGQIAVVPEDQPTLTFEQAQELEAWIRTNQLEIRRPAFPEIVNGPWNPPGVADIQFTPEQLQRREELDRNITRLERQIQRMTGESGQDPGGGGRGGREPEYEDIEDFAPPGRGGRGGRAGNDRGNRDTDTRAADRETRQLTKLQDELYAAQKELNELLGFDEEPVQASNPGYNDPADYRDPEAEFDNPGGYRPPGTGVYGNNNRPGGNAEQVPDMVKVWAHDLTVEPGKNYRYKVLVSVLNPLYRFPRLSPKQLAANKNRISIGPSEEEIDATPWSISAEVTLDPKHYFFVTSGSKDQKRADIEVWKVYNGIWRSKEFTEYPGNVIGQDQAQLEGVDTAGRGVNMNVGPIMLDVDSVNAANGRPAVRVLFLDPDTNRIETRMVNDDKNSDARKRLETEADIATKKQQNRLSDARQ